MLARVIVYLGALTVLFGLLLERPIPMAIAPDEGGAFGAAATWSGDAGG